MKKEGRSVLIVLIIALVVVLMFSLTLVKAEDINDTDTTTSSTDQEKVVVRMIRHLKPRASTGVWWASVFGRLISESPPNPLRRPAALGRHS